MPACTKAPNLRQKVRVRNGARKTASRLGPLPQPPLERADIEEKER